MSKYFFASKANCPHYKGEYNRNIYCDVTDGPMCSKMVFSSLNQLKAYRKQHCERCGKGCVTAMGMKEKAEM